MAGTDRFATTMLVERERLALGPAAHLARRGSGSVTMIEAVAGTGKTALLDLAGQLGTERGLRVLRAGGAEVDRDVPLALLRGLFGQAAADHPARDTILDRAAGPGAGPPA